MCYFSTLQCWPFLGKGSSQQLCEICHYGSHILYVGNEGSEILILSRPPRISVAGQEIEARSKSTQYPLAHIYSCTNVVARKSYNKDFPYFLITRSRYHHMIVLSFLILTSAMLWHYMDAWPPQEHKF